MAGNTQVIHQQHAAVRAQIAINQCTDVMILRQKDAIFTDGLRQQGFVTGIDSALGGINDTIDGVTRRPRMTGLPPIFPGSTTMRARRAADFMIQT